ncbi:unnamed protein product, partial [Haemonchus placei]|uniref:RING-type domain-containing protein n=1 Tax=Haemonchus placei TaxID=6290 RepID=A0A158QRM8_HAEPC
MESVRTFSSTVHEFWRGVVEWRSPASGPYLMLVNIAFWSTALYCSEFVQLRILLSLAAGVVGWDVLLSPTHERSIATHVALWPVQNIWRTLSVCGCLYSSHQLQMQQLETACIAAYATVGCLLVNPVWNYYEVNQKIVHGSKYLIVRPLQAVYRALKYVVLLQFVPRKFNTVFFFIFPCNDLLVMKISLNIITPTKNFFYAVGRWLRYWFCAHWWPDLKLWIKEKIVDGLPSSLLNFYFIFSLISCLLFFLLSCLSHHMLIGGPLRRAFNYFCFGLMYVFCAWLRRFKDYTMIQLRRLGGFLHRTVVVPTKSFLRQKFDEFRGWLRRCLHRLAVAIRDSVLWPICVLVVDAGRELSLLMYRVLLQPVLDYVYQRYKILETAILIYFLGPVCDTIVRNIPEKSPFCGEFDRFLTSLCYPHFLEEERDFTAGLAFPTIHASESSDEEIDLKVRKKPATTRKKRQKEEKPAGPADVGAAPE